MMEKIGDWFFFYGTLFVRWVLCPAALVLALLNAFYGHYLELFVASIFVPFCFLYAGVLHEEARRQRGL